MDLLDCKISLKDSKDKVVFESNCIFRIINNSLQVINKNNNSEIILLYTKLSNITSIGSKDNKISFFLLNKKLKKNRIFLETDICNYNILILEILKDIDIQLLLSKLNKLWELSFSN